jgi:hypothetical protein
MPRVQLKLVMEQEVSDAKVLLASRSPVALPRTTHVQNEDGERRLPDALSP